MLATAALSTDDLDALHRVDVIAAERRIDPLLARIRTIQAERAAFVTRIDRAQAERPCLTCGARPTVLFPGGRLCADHAPPQPTRGYCAPNRCYCRADSCQRPG